MKRILVPVGCRSDAGLSAPVIKRLREHFIVDTISLSPQNFGQSYDWMDRRLCLHEHMEPYDLVFITGDRVEMCAAAAAAFHNKVPIAHFYAGVMPGCTVGKNSIVGAGSVLTTSVPDNEVWYGVTAIFRRKV
jgi:UDP-N-acetylglucosamine 2-epimerase